MPYCNYSNLGTNCVPQTIALSSNQKFLSPLNDIYGLCYTRTFLYPGHEEDCTLNMHNKPNIIDNLHTNEHSGSKKCSNCKPYFY